MRSIVVLAVLGVALDLTACGPPTPPPVLTAPQYSAIQTALTDARVPSPKSLECCSPWLVATFEIRDPMTASQVRAFADTALFAIRNSIYADNTVKHYRVTVNGPPPGPGLVRRYGSARFIEGGSFEWEPAQ